MKEVLISKMREDLTERAQEAYYLGEKFLITRRGRPLAVLMGVKEFKEKFPGEIPEKEGEAD